MSQHIDVAGYQALVQRGAARALPGFGTGPGRRTAKPAEPTKPRRKPGPAETRRLLEPTETAFCEAILDQLTLFGWWRHHELRSDMGSAGWPDEVWLRDRLVIAELKARGKQLTNEQRQVIAQLHAADVEIYILRPADHELIDRLLAPGAHRADLEADRVATLVRERVPLDGWTAPPEWRRSPRRAARRKPTQVATR